VSAPVRLHKPLRTTAGWAYTATRIGAVSDISVGRQPRSVLLATPQEPIARPRRPHGATTVLEECKEGLISWKPDAARSFSGEKKKDTPL
jgi:hypothetical protein